MSSVRETGIFGEKVTITIDKCDGARKITVKGGVEVIAYSSIVDVHMREREAVEIYAQRRFRQLKALWKKERREREELEAERDELLKALYDPEVAAKHFAEDLGLKAD